MPLGVTPKISILQNAATSTGNGTPLSCHDASVIGVYVSYSGTSFTVVFEGTGDDSNWVSVPAVDMSTGKMVTSTSTSGQYLVYCAGLSQFRARISAITSCSVTFTAVLSDLAAPFVGTRPAVTIAQTPTVSTSPGYSVGDCVGGKLTFASAVLGNGMSGVITTVVLTDLAKQNVAMDLVLFDRDFTAGTDNSPMDIDDSDLPNLIGVVPIIVADYTSFADNSVATVRNVGLGFTAYGTSIYGQLVTRGMPTYASTQAITVKIMVLRE